MKKHFIILICCAAIFAACKKSTDITPPSQSTADFIKNTEWVGTSDKNGFEYPPPCALKFNTDNTFTMYSHFVFFPNGVETRTDSITGNIQSIDDLSTSVTRITTNINTTFRPVTTNYIDITDRKKIVGMSSDATQPPTFQMDIFPANGISVYGTHWKGPEWHSTVTDKSYAYPDLIISIFRRMELIQLILSMASLFIFRRIHHYNIYINKMAQGYICPDITSCQVALP